ncbi:MAG TPA: alpha/beta hydrolase [Plantibacter sp.]|uniref:alpha/beta fold hydrolase n=1 Tax=unclassified Plantibacter TaxID=2624265 RepID=UPI002C05CE25|nr:alpha/beta hydrolase [Plantibacter sp.]
MLVAGASSSMDWWDEEFCRALAAGDATSGPRRVLRYDLRDTGQSETVPPGAAEYTGNELLGDLAALIEHADAAPAHVVGLSLGGGLVQQLALRRPELLATITLMSTTPGGPGSALAASLPPPTPELMQSFASEPKPVDETDPDAVGDSFVEMERLFSGSIPVDEVRIRRIAAAAAARTRSLRSAESHWSLADGPGARSDLDSITLPTLVIHGAQDPLFPLAHGERLAGVIPGARLVVVPGMGHQNPPPPSWPQIVGELLRHTA